MLIHYVFDEKQNAGKPHLLSGDVKGASLRYRRGFSLCKKLLIAITAMLVVVNAYALTQTVNGYTWQYNPKGLGVIIYNTSSIDSAAISPSPDGDVIVPDKLGGKNVIGIGKNAFASCYGLKSVKIPNSVVSIADKALISCSGLTNLIINSGVTLIGNSAFEGCISLQSVSIPATVTRLGDSAFKDCATLVDVTFEGDAPDIGEGVYLGTPRALVTHISEGSIGWSDDFSDTLPASWNGRRLALVSDSGGSGTGNSGSDGSGSSGDNGGGNTSSVVSLTVTNVVVHYVLNSVVPEIAMPVGTDTGFVSVVTEIKGGAVAIPESWAANYPEFMAKFGSDFSAALTKPTGKRDSQGNALLVWQDYVAGTDPTRLDDVFKATITMVEGEPVIGHTPELPEAEKAKRKYTTYGKVRLQDTEWRVIDGNAADYNFFKVVVEMKKGE